MIRGRIAQIRRDAGVCALCQHRLLAQRSLKPQSRPISTTTILRQDEPQNSTSSAAPRLPGLGGWGAPRGGFGWGGSPLAKPANNATTVAAASESLLSPHELEQRKRLLAQREAARKPVEAQTQQPLPPFKHVFNPEKQNAMYENWQKEAADKKGGVGSSVRIGTLAGRQLDPPVSSRPTPRVNHRHPRKPQPSSEERAPVTTRLQWDMSTGRKLRSAPAIAPQKAATSPEASTATSSPMPAPPPVASPSTTGVEQSSVHASNAPTDITPRPQSWAHSKPKAWGSMATKVYASEPSQQTATPTQASPLAAPSPTSTREADVGVWSQLQRKAAPPKKDGTADFFNNLLKKELQPAKEESMEDWGRDLDSQPRQKKKEDPYVAKVAEETPDNRVSESERDMYPAKPKVERHGRLQYEVEETESEIPEQRRAKRVQKKTGKGGRGASSRYEEEDEMDEDEINAYEAYLEKQRLKAERKAAKEAERTGPIPIKLPELITISALASALKIEVPLFLSQLAELGFENITQDSIMAGETAALVAQEYGYEPSVDIGIERDLKPRPPAEDPSLLPQRPPVVTIMGHVDHGKTTLLDFLRKSSVAAQEHGGITQHIGAFSVKMSTGKQITFLDTPGHAAFLTMRQRGANVTDIVVLVVAADDSVKPQTLEALKHARSAKVPIIVAINKVDKDTARVEQVKNDLARNGVELEDFGGDVQVVCVSGKTGLGMDELEENIVTLAEILDMRAEDDGPAEGWILESSLKASGKVATVLVRRGTMRPGDIITAGTTFAKIRHLRNEAGVNVTEAGPGTAIEIYGWRELPAAGDEVIQASDESRARTAIEYREGLREQEQAATDHAAISEVRNVQDEQRRRAMQTARAEVRDMNRGKFVARKAAFLREAKLAADEASRAAEGEGDGPRLINFAVKADVHGSVEAVCSSIQEIGNNEVTPRILRSGAGPITEFDVEHAAMSGSVIINFATTTPSNVKRLADEQGVKIIDHTIIYHLIDDVKATLSSFLTPDVASKVLGEAEVQQVFQYNTKGRAFKNIAGCRVRNGVVAAGSMYRIFRGGEKIFEGKLETLKHHKKDVTEMRKGTECGMGFEEFQDIQAGDQIQAYEEIRTARKL